MGEIIKINDTEIMVLEHQKERWVTLKQISDVHGTELDRVRRQFDRYKNKRLKFKEHYLVFKGEAGRQELQNMFNMEIPINENNKRFTMYLLNERGYLLLCKVMTDDVSWDVQEKLVNAYFRLKEKSVVQTSDDPLMALELVLKAMREAKEVQEQHSKEIKNIQEKTAQIEARYQTQPSEGSKTMTEIASEMGLISETGFPHHMMIGAIAREVGLRTSIRMIYDNEYTQTLMRDVQGVPTVTCYVKPKGVELIKSWWNSNYAEAFKVETYKKNTKTHSIGQIRSQYYLIGGKKFKVDRIVGQVA